MIHQLFTSWIKYQDIDNLLKDNNDEKDNNNDEKDNSLKDKANVYQTTIIQMYGVKVWNIITSSKAPHVKTQPLYDIPTSPIKMIQKEAFLHGIIGLITLKKDEKKDKFKDALKAYRIWCVFLLFTSSICLVIPPDGKYDYGSKPTKRYYYYFGKLLNGLLDYRLFKWFKDVASNDIKLLYDFNFIEYFVKDFIKVVDGNIRFNNHYIEKVFSKHDLYVRLSYQYPLKQQKYIPPNTFNINKDEYDNIKVCLLLIMTFH